MFKCERNERFPSVLVFVVVFFAINHKQAALFGPGKSTLFWIFLLQQATVLIEFDDEDPFLSFSFHNFDTFDCIHSCLASYIDLL